MQTAGRDRGVLGKHAKSYSPSLRRPAGNRADGAIADDGKRNHRVIERFALQAAARDLLPGEKRINECLRTVIPLKATVEHWFAFVVKRSHFKNLITCNSIWICPVCSAKISERRRVELTEAINRNGDLVPALLTLTLEHTRGHSLKESLSALLKAYKRMTQGKAWAGIRSRFAIVGTIRALEPTHGANGWHPHLHVLVLFEGKPDEDALRDTLSARWIDSVKRQDRFANSHGCDIEFRKKAIGDYVTKFGSEWTLEHELVKAVSKVSRSAKGLSPFGLLSDYFRGNKHSGRLFVEYARALKGSKQLVWSRGLAKKLGIERKTDAEVNAEIEQDAVLLARYSLAQWKAILGNDIRGELLSIGNSGDADKVWAFLAQFGIGRWENDGRVQRPRLPAEMKGGEA